MMIVINMFTCTKQRKGHSHGNNVRDDKFITAITMMSIMTTNNTLMLHAKYGQYTILYIDHNTYKQQKP